MKQDKKISIIAPAYQAERFIQRYIDCVLNFDYKNLELIIVNDASTDKTHEIIESNRERIINAGIDFKYINLEENKGQANAIDLGLKFITGEYLSWHDVDDIFHPNCLSKSLEVLLNNPECKIVFSKTNLVDGNDTTKILKTLPKKNFKHKNIFLDFILGKNVIFAPMRFIETEALFNIIKDKSIFISRSGQNWQLILPMVYNYKWAYIDEVLSEAVIHTTSHSHSSKRNQHKKSNIELLDNTIDRIDMPKMEKIYYKIQVRLKYFKKDLGSIFRLTINFKRKIFKITILGFDFSF